MASKLDKGSKKRVLCGHCGDYVSKRTYYQHKRLYFDTRSQEWSDSRVYNPITTPEDIEVNTAKRQRSSSPESFNSEPDDEQMNEGTDRLCRYSP